MDDINTPGEFVTWIDAKLDLLQRVNDGIDGVASDYWPRVWEDAIGFAMALGIDTESLDGPLPRVTYVAEVNGRYDYETPERAVRDKTEKRLKSLRSMLLGEGKKSTNPDRDDWIVKQDEARKTLKEIREGIGSQNIDWWPLNSEQAVFNVLKRRGRR